MKTAGRLLAVLLSALMIAASLGCSLMPTNAGGGGEKETKAPVATTAVPTEAAQEDDLIEVRTLYRDLYQTLTKAETSVVYDDPAVGQKLRASSTLVKDGETLTYRAKVDRLNPADAERFVTEETLDPVVGTAAEIRENYAGLFVWDRVATGLILATPEVAQGYVESPVIASDAEGKILTASVPDDRLEDFFGIELPGVTGMTIAVAYTASAIRSLTLAYTQNAASVTVTVTYTY